MGLALLVDSRHRFLPLMSEHAEAAVHVHGAASKASTCVRHHDGDEGGHACEPGRPGQGAALRDPGAGEQEVHRYGPQCEAQLTAALQNQVAGLCDPPEE